MPIIGQYSGLIGSPKELIGCASGLQEGHGDLKEAKGGPKRSHLVPYGFIGGHRGSKETIGSH